MKLQHFFLCLLVAVLLLPSEAQDTPEKWIELHNEIRARVGVPPLKWNQTVEDYANKYSETRSGDCQLIHSYGPYGENIYWGQGEGATDAAAAMKLWADDEAGNYDYDSNTCAEGTQCLHYTQIVWSTTTDVGCGVASCAEEENKVFITCNYYPPGNYIGQRPY